MADNLLDGIGLAFSGSLATTTVTVGGIEVGEVASLAGIAELAVGAAVGSIASQGFGIAIGQQKSIDWNQVGLSALSAGISAGVGTIPSLGAGDPGSLTNVALSFARGTISSFVTQDLGVITGLQKDFSWADVAASGAGAAAGSFIGGTLDQSGLNASMTGPVDISLGTPINGLVSGMAGALASAATRSVATGTDFGDNLKETLPQAIGNTIGNAVASGIAQSDNTAAQGQQSPQPGAQQGSGTASLPYGALPDDNTVVAGADTSAAEIVVTGQNQSQANAYFSGQNISYLQNISYIKGGKNTVAWYNRLLYRIPYLSSTNNFVYSRSQAYGNMDASLNSPGSAYQSNFFSAASNVTGIFGLTGGQLLSELTSLALEPTVAADLYKVGSPFDEQTLANVQKLGANLWQNVNVPLYQALYNGDDSYRLFTGQTLGSVASGSENSLDQALVHNEQSYVQAFLNGLPSDQRDSFIQQSNEALKIPGTPQVILDAISNLGHPFDFGNQADREAIGMAEVSRPSSHTRMMYGMSS